MSYTLSQKGRVFNFVDAAVTKSHDLFPPGFYKFVLTQFGYHIVQLDSDYLVPETKLYGSAEKRADRILNTFKERNRSTGVLLSGSKGTGKTLLMRTVGIKAVEEGMPVFIIDEAHYDSAFMDYIEKIQQRVVFLYDEYEKLYDSEEAQNGMLRIFDGVSNVNILSVLAVNNYPSEYLIDRPGRMFYHFKYGTLEEQFVREYAIDNLANQENVNGLVAVSKMYGVFSFDVLKAYVEEMNRYNETARQVMEVINAEAVELYMTRYVRVFQDGVPYFYWDSDTIINPLTTRNMCITPYGVSQDYTLKTYIPKSMDVFDDDYEGDEEVPETNQIIFPVKKNMITKHANGNISIDIGNKIVVWFFTDYHRSMENADERAERRLAELENEVVELAKEEVK